jgi:hypothetical protein
MKIGDKVKHINTGNHIYEIINLNDMIATLKRPKELITIIKNPTKMKIDISICHTKNLILLQGGTEV